MADPTPCRGCGRSVPQVRLQATPTSPVYWIPERLCGACKAEERRAEQRTAMTARLTRANVPRRLWGYTWDRTTKIDTKTGETFDAFQQRLQQLEPPHIGLTAANVRLATELRRWSPSEGSMYVQGPVGGGKTTLVAAKVRQLLEQDYPGSVLYLPEAELFERQRERAANRNGVAGPSVVQLCRQAGVLVLDDVGTTEEIRAWQRDVVEQILCARYDAAAPVIVTSNLGIDWTDEEAAAKPSDRPPCIASLFGERVASRLTDMCRRRVVRLIGVDWRTGQQHRADPPARARPGLPEPSQKALPYRDHAMAAANDHDDEEDR